MSTASILVTDDEANIRMMLRTALKTEGYEVEEATNGREALDVINRHKPDVVILDLSMPMLDGMGVLEQLQSLPRQNRPRVIVLTAYGSIPAAVKATRLGAIDFLEKPVLPEELREAVATALRDPVVIVESGGDEAVQSYTSVLDRVRKALRMAQYSDAESLLMRAADLAEKDPAYFNLLGVLYETKKQWSLAKKFYGKAMRANKHYEPAQQNMRRIYEFYTLGASSEPIALGDGHDIKWAQRVKPVS